MTKPLLPYLLFHPKFIAKYGTARGQRGDMNFQDVRSSLEKKYWRANCFVIDTEMRQFKLLEVRNSGVAWTFWNLIRNNDNRIFNIEHIFDNEAVQLSFDQARQTYVESVCKGRWWTASGETEAEFRTRNASYTNWLDLIAPVSLAGRYP